MFALASRRHAASTILARSTSCWGELAAAREAGKVRAIGLSNHGVEALERAEAVAHVDSLQPPFSLIKREVLADVLGMGSAEIARLHDAGVVAGPAA